VDTDNGGEPIRSDSATRRPRWPHPAWTDEGNTPDYRFSLANERTFLAWIRTALALLAGAIAIVQIVPAFTIVGARTTVGAVLAAAGMLIAAVSYRRWSANERAMRQAQPLPFPVLVPLLGALVTLIGLVVLLLTIFAGR
jgi:putative membrane protein